MEKIIGVLPLLKTEKPDAQRKYTYVGPDYTNGITRDGQLLQPKHWTDTDIDQFLAQTEWAQSWFTKA